MYPVFAKEYVVLPTFRSLFLCLFFVTAVISSSPASANTICVNQPKITIITKDQESIQRICSAAEKTLRFLGNYGLAAKRQIIVEIIDKGIVSRGYLAYATYDSRIDRVKIMSYRSILYGYENPVMYDEFFDLDHYTGAIAHEITHAVFHHNTKNPSPGTAPQEYLAHAVQLGVLPDYRREEIISRMNVSAWLPGDAISDIYMALEPGKFAVKSYKHLTTTEDPQAFIEILLNSKWFYVYIP